MSLSLTYIKDYSYFGITWRNIHYNLPLTMYILTSATSREQERSMHLIFELLSTRFLHLRKCC
jgi:hypothetical protein